METLRLFFTEPKRQALLIVIITLLAYGFTARPLDFATDIYVQGNLAYLTSAQDGVRVLNITDPSQPSLVAFYDTPGSANSIIAVDRFVFIADGPEGLLVLELTPEGSLVMINQLDTPGNSQDLVLNGQVLYLADGRAGIHTFLLNLLPEGISVQRSLTTQVGEDITALSIHQNHLLAADQKNRAWILSIDNPQAPRTLAELDTKSPVNDLSATGDLLFLATDQRGLVVASLQDPNNPIELAAIDIGGAAQVITTRNNLVLLGTDQNEIRVFDFSASATPTELEKIQTLASATGFFLTENQLFIVNGFEGLQIITSAVLLNPIWVGRTPAKVYPEDVFVSYPYAYLAAGENGLQVLDISNPATPRQINQLDTPGYAHAVYQSGDLVFVANGSDGLSVVDISDLTQPLPILETIPLEDQVLDVVVQAGFAYLANGSNGLRIIDLRDPRNPNELGRLDTPGNANGLALYSTYVLLADGGAGLRIIDTSNPLQPQEIGAWDTSGDAQAVGVLLKPAAVQPQATPDSGSSMPLPDETQSTAAAQAPAGQPFALVADGSGGLVVLDISQPRQPSQTAVYEQLDFIQDITVQGSVVAAAARAQGVSLLDLNNPAKPVQISLANTPGEARAVVMQGTLVYTADFSRGLQILEISNPSQPGVIGFRDTPEKVLDLFAVGNIVFAVDGQDGLWVYDASNPTTPVEVSFANTPGEPQAVTISGSRAYVADGSKGVQIFDLSNPLKPARIGEYDTPGEARDVAAVNQLVYVADGSAGIQILDVSDPTAVQLVASLDTPGTAQGIAGTDRHIYVADGDQGLRIINVSIPFAPVVDSIVREANQARQVQIQGSYAYIADGANGLRIINIASPVRPFQVGQFNKAGNASDVYLTGDTYAFLSDLTGGVWVVDISNPAQPLEVGFNALPGSPSGIAAVPTGGAAAAFRIYAAYGETGLNIFESARSVIFSPLAKFETTGTATLGQIWRGLLGFLAGDLGSISSKVPRTLAQVTFDLGVMGLLGFLLWLRIVAQYVLPIHKWSERREVASRLVTYFYRRHGPAVAVREAKPNLQEEEEKRRGPGVIRVDLSSAVVLEKSSGKNTLSRPIGIPFWYRFFPHRMEPRRPVVRITGPGIVFTNANETIRGAVDLRPQLRLRPAIKALTRDGIEVTNNVVTTFTLGQDADVLHITFENGVRHASGLRVVAVEEAVTPKYRKTNHTLHKKMLRCPPRNARRGMMAKRKVRRRQVRIVPMRTSARRKPMVRALRRANRLFISPPVSRRPIVLFRTFLRIKSLTDELDEIDKREMFEYIQNEMQQTGMKPYTTVEPTSRTGTPNKFNPERVFAALTSTAQALDRAEEVKDWTDLPPHIATQFYRDMLAEYDYDQLYEPKEPEKFPLKELKDRFRLRMRNLGILSLRYIERVDGKALEKGQKLQPGELQISAVRPLTSPKLLRTRGIKLLAASFGEQKPDESVSKQRIDYWRARWQQVANERVGEFEREAAAVQGNVWNLYSAQMVESLKAIVVDQRYTDEVLTLRLFQALENLTADPETQKLLPGDTLKVIDAVRQWLLSADTPGGGGGGGTLPQPSPVPPNLPGSPSQNADQGADHE